MWAMTDQQDRLAKETKPSTPEQNPPTPIGYY